MPFVIVEREETLVAGLAVRSPKRALGEARDKALEKTWSTLLAQNVDRPLASAYVDHAAEINSYFTQIVGYECSSIDQVGRGHLVARIPAGTYAKFSSVGTFPDLFDVLWGQIRDAEESQSDSTVLHRRFRVLPARLRDRFVRGDSATRHQAGAAMSFEIVKRESTDFGGLVLPAYGVEFVGARDRPDEVHARARPVARCRGADHRLRRGPGSGVDRCDRISLHRPRSPRDRRRAGARPVRLFCEVHPDGRSSDPIEDVWIQAEVAEKEGRIERAYAEEIEVFRAPNNVELFISLT